MTNEKAVAIANDRLLGGDALGSLPEEAHQALKAIGLVKSIRAIALGGSSTRGHVDRWSDIDVFCFCLDQHLGPAVEQLIHELETVERFSGNVVGPRLSARFGIKTTVIPTGKRTLEVFINSPTIFAPLPMTANMRFLDSISLDFYTSNFSQFVSSDDASVAHLLNSIVLELLCELRSFAKARFRNHNGAHYASRLRVILLALGWHGIGHAYDPHLVERKPIDAQLAPLEHRICEILDPSNPALQASSALFALSLSLIENAGATSDALESYRRRFDVELEWVGQLLQLSRSS